ncbi:ankyrin repeat domain-containing protein [Mycobacterium sp. BMJ-28]
MPDQLVEYQEGYARVVVSRSGDELVFWSDFDDNGRSIVSESRIAVDDFVAKGDGPWPWYDLGDRRAGALRVLDALGVAPPAWTQPLPRTVLDLFDRAGNGWASVTDLLAAGVEVDVLDPCGASPLWYAVRALQPEAAIALIGAGADPARRIELSARGERFTNILHEIVGLGRTVALTRALARGADPAVRDSGGATPLHVLGDRSDHLNPGIAEALVAAGADVDAQSGGGERPIEAAARRVLPATVGALLELGAEPARALDALLVWWSVNARWYAYRSAEVVRVVEILRAGGAVVTEQHRELAAEAGVEAVGNTLRS